MGIYLTYVTLGLMVYLWIKTSLSLDIIQPLATGLTGVVVCEYVNLYNLHQNSRYRQLGVVVTLLVYGYTLFQLNSLSKELSGQVFAEKSPFNTFLVWVISWILRLQYWKLYLLTIVTLIVVGVYEIMIVWCNFSSIRQYVEQFISLFSQTIDLFVDLRSWYLFHSHKELYEKNTTLHCEHLGNSIENPGECIICQDELNGSTPIRRLKCGHLFHPSCINEWMHSKFECPTCRQPVLTIDVNFRFIDVIKKIFRHIYTYARHHLYIVDGDRRHSLTSSRIEFDHQFFGRFTIS